MSELPKVDRQETLSFATRLVSSGNFDSLFREGMTLVEETATYLDGLGREESRDLDRSIALAYSTESMRLTTRLMQLASWLLLQRAVNEGEMSPDQAHSEKNKVRLERNSGKLEVPSWNKLPDNLKNLISRSVRLQDRIIHMDNMLVKERMSEPLTANDNPIAAQLSQLNAVFGK
ncbi:MULTISPECIES: DUF1465 family protein [Pseudovibrio]|uniref:protease adaptor protein RcdA n=1 Tax=Stappiaceae TaxID=2821832 RepID=UPI002364FD23|nr:MULTISPECIES: DUF1465 family protein [Pseudovibrio]MDD7911892.1 DUF1465 family protein [Pseudovibrio exalbescens]MDX5595442.1 DUF1465 family protein [Pseudovibrio sp. SPO723]